MKTKLFFLFSIFVAASLIFFLYPYVDRYMDIQNQRAKIGDLISMKVEPRQLSCNLQAVNEIDNTEFIGY